MHTLFSALRRRTALLCLGLLAALLCLLAAPHAAQASGPSTITYTGQLLSGNAPVANGLYDFQFSLYTVASGGAQTGSTVSVTSVPVEDGVFYVELNFGSAVNSSALYLQTAYRLHGGSSYTTQSPRKLLATTAFTDYSASSGYALISGNTWRLQGSKISTTAPTAGQVLEWNGGTSLWTPTTFSAGTTYTAGNGLTLSGNQFSVALPLALTGSSNPIISATNTGGTTAYLGGGNYAVYGKGTGILTGVRGENSSDGAGVTGFTGSGYGVYGSASGNGYGVYGTVSGANPGTEGVNTGSGPGVYGSSATGPGGYFTSASGDGLDANTSSGYGVYASAGNGYGLYGFSNSGVGVAAETNGGTAVSSINYGDGPAGSFSAEGNGPGVSAYSNGTSVSNPALLASNGSSSGIAIYSLSNSTDANLVISNGGGGDLIRAFSGGNNLYFRVTSNGTTITRVLQITGGADVAEPYTVGAAEDVKPLPGMVVSIDPAHVGQMTLAHTAYDRAVAGILSGGGGIQPGLTLRQSGTVADGTLPVACTGRVWCFCDADAGGAITPGDLLTTSATPGHAMKAADETRSRGAILGKAMSSLPSGKGLVLVLVTLQ